MIFVTVGTQGQFDRLIRTIDEWAGACGRTDIFAQIGPSDYRSKHIRAERFVDASEFRQCVEAASVVISHAGMGSIITALELGKRIIVMPRRASLGEHRNDHQIATAKRFGAHDAIAVAFTELELLEELGRLQGQIDTVQPSTQAAPQLIFAVRTFIETAQICVNQTARP